MPSKKKILVLLSLLLVVVVIVVVLNKKEADETETIEQLIESRIPEDQREAKPILEDMYALLQEKDFDALRVRIDEERDNVKGDSLTQFSSIEVSLYLYQNDLEGAKKVMKNIIENESEYDPTFVEAIKSQLEEINNGINPADKVLKGDPEDNEL